VSLSATFVVYFEGFFSCVCRALFVSMRESVSGIQSSTCQGLCETLVQQRSTEVTCVCGTLLGNHWWADLRILMKIGVLPSKSFEIFCFKLFHDIDGSVLNHYKIKI
jgi:hypothetical protein